MEKHPQAELIKQVVDGLAVPQEWREADWEWFDRDLRALVSSLEGSEWRAKPPEPEKVYPKCKMTEAELNNIFSYAKRKGYQPTLFLADEVLRNAVANGHLVLPPECSPTARDMAIAKAVAAETVREIYTHSTRSQSEAIRAASQNTGRLAEIIESVKP